MSKNMEQESRGKVMAFDACKIFEERLSENGVEPPLLGRSQFHGFILHAVVASHSPHLEAQAFPF